MVREKRGFSLLELLGVIALLAILFAIGIPYLAYMRSNNAINTAADRLHGELQQAQGKAKGFGVPIDDAFRAAGGFAAATSVASGSTEEHLALRVRTRQTTGSVPTVVSFSDLGSMATLDEVRLANIPLFDMDAVPNLTGLVAELGLGSTPTNFTPFASFAFDANGEILLLDSSQPGVVTLGRIGDHAYRLEVGGLGKLSLAKYSGP
ncbi:MAG: prepilin-type N-terminal cleavage/methylation domain-containing protein [Candidatus Eremiobacteraeota bacterium]|nr:prepilin-type N-terminal cleavage/methylation domain-containing protein [Candidatus Eremiobacteraeota bacterium]